MAMNQIELSSTQKLCESQKNKLFGFKCLHYSVSECAGFLQVCIFNKRKLNAKVRLQTRNGTARAGEDFDYKDEVIYFRKNDGYAFEYIKIIDDDDWDPDEDFFV